MILVSLFLGISGIQQKSKIVKITPDALSIVLIAIFFPGMISDFSKLSEFDAKTIISILLTIIAIILLLKRPCHLKQPILNFALLKDQAFSAHLLGFLLVQIHSLGSAFMNTAWQFAGAIGTLLTSAIVALSQGGHATSVNTAAGTQHAFIFLGVLGLYLFVLFYKAIKPSDQAK